MQQVNTSNSTPQRLLRLPEVCTLVGLGRSSIYEGVKAGTFPSPVKLSRRAVCWPAASIDAWITERIKAGGKA